MSLVNPKDKQSVPLATQLLPLFSEAVKDTDKSKQLSFRIADFANKLHLFKYVIDGILCLYTDIKTSIKEQLEKVSLINKNFSQINCTMIFMKIYRYLMLCSNDVLERLFGNIRMKYRQCLIYSARTIYANGDMMTKHPEWFKKNRNVMERLCLDYSSPKDWSPELLNLMSVDIISVWNAGRPNSPSTLW